MAADSPLNELRKLLFSSDLTSVKIDVKRSLENSTIQDISDFQLSVTVNEDLQRAYSEWIESRSVLPQQKIEGEELRHPVLKEECRSILKTVISDVLSENELYKNEGISRVVFDMDSALTVTVTLGMVDAGKNEQKRSNRHNCGRKFKRRRCEGGKGLNVASRHN